MSFKGYLRSTEFVGAYLKGRHLKKWKRGGCPLPPPDDFKQLAVFYHAVINNLEVLVETGTFLGDMLWAQKEMFRQIYSIELSTPLYERAKARFTGVSNVHLIHGDSSEKLAVVLSELKSPALFWLDGHYSGGITARGRKICPIFAELSHILASDFDHTILIDDARLFIGEDDYPTLDELSAFVTTDSKYCLRQEGDILVLNAVSKNC